MCYTGCFLLVYIFLFSGQLNIAVCSGLYMASNWKMANRKIIEDYAKCILHSVSTAQFREVVGLPIAEYCYQTFAFQNLLRAFLYNYPVAVV